MFRNLAIGIAGLILSALLLGLAGWFTLNFSEQGRLIREHQANRVSDEQFAEVFFQNAPHSLFLTEFVAMPFIAIVVGCFAGVFARERAWLPALISLSPVLLFFFLPPTAKGLGLCAMYTALAIGTAMMVSRLRQSHRRS